MFRKQIDSGGEMETIVGPSVNLKGNLKSEGNIKLKGKVSGEVKTKGDVFIDEEAEVKASVSARSIKVAGTVTGDLVTQGDVEITETGKVIGNINSKSLIIKAGALFVGKSTMEEKQEGKEKSEDELLEPEPEIE